MLIHTGNEVSESGKRMTMKLLKQKMMNCKNFAQVLNFGLEKVPRAG